MTSKYLIQRFIGFSRNNTVNYFFRRYSSYQTSKLVGNPEEYNSKYEISNSPEDWKYVERILAPSLVPKPKIKSEYVSGWKPPIGKAVNWKYFIPRNRNYMIPVYLKISHRGMRKITKIIRIQGDIFALEQDLRKHLEEVAKKEIAIQVNEFVGYIHIKGDFVNIVKDYLLSKGF